MRFAAAIIVFITLAMASSVRADLSGDAARYAKPGRIVSVAGHAMNVYCEGSGSTTVVLDSGLGDWSPAWIATQSKVATFTRVCAYDRAGYGFSGPGPFPRTHTRIARELHGLLHNGGILPPYVLVGHSFGGTDVQLFGDLYRGELAGMLLLDALPVGTSRDLPSSSFDSYPNEMKKCSAAASRHTLARDRLLYMRCFADGVEDASPSQLRLERSSQSLRRTFRSIAMEPYQYAAIASEAASESTPDIEAHEKQLQRGLYPLGSIPLIVLTSTRARFEREMIGYGLKPHDASAFAYTYVRLEDGLPRLSRNSRRFFATKSGHYIQADDGELVVSAIRSLVKGTSIQRRF